MISAILAQIPQSSPNPAIFCSFGQFSAFSAVLFSSRGFRKKKAESPTMSTSFHRFFSIFVMASDIKTPACVAAVGPRGREAAVGRRPCAVAGDPVLRGAVRGGEPDGVPAAVGVGGQPPPAGDPRLRLPRRPGHAAVCSHGLRRGCRSSLPSEPKDGAF